MNGGKQMGKSVYETNKVVWVDINSYLFRVCFVEPKEIEGSDGILYHNERFIKIRNDLDLVGTKLILKHEIVHAVLLTQGRVYQKKFDLEEMCEFIAYKGTEIERLTNLALKKLLESPNVTEPYDD